LRIALLMATLALLTTVDVARAANDSASDDSTTEDSTSSSRIQRPHSTADTNVQYNDSFAPAADWQKTGSSLDRSRLVDHHQHEKLGTTDGAVPFCSTVEGDREHARINYICCDVTSQYFPIRIAGPSQHFGLWLRLNLYPTLCHSVLCQRQCALNGYESCNALGGEKTLVQKLMDNVGDCSSGSCCD